MTHTPATAAVILPDMANLYPLGEETVLSPVNAQALTVIATEAAELLTDALCAHDWEIINAYLPPCAQGSDEVFTERYIQAFIDLGERLACGEGSEPGCTGEEVALHMLLDDFEARMDDAEEHQLLAELVGDLPTHESDWDTRWLRDELFEDHDALWLFEPACDGIENDDEAAAYIGAVNLKPSQWFLPFNP